VVTLKIGEGMVHCYLLLALLIPIAIQAMTGIREFVSAKADPTL